MLFTVTVVVVVPTAHCPAFGVNVYVVVAVLLNAGVQLPVMPFVEVVGNGFVVLPKHTGAIAPKLGTTLSTDTVIVVFTAHCPGVGVKV
ncbi:hypothetical protein DBR32_09625 [Taibaiella sp. KBW10]|nr:hypothetical protein DBR32_09625 [Taibaiella sp. KBW10]